MRSTVKVARGLGVLLTKAEVQKLAEMAGAEGARHLSAWLAGKVRELILASKLDESERVAGNGVQGATRECVRTDQEDSSGSGNITKNATRTTKQPYFPTTERMDDLNANAAQNLKLSSSPSTIFTAVEINTERESKARGFTDGCEDEDFQKDTGSSATTAISASATLATAPMETFQSVVRDTTTRKSANNLNCGTDAIPTRRGTDPPPTESETNQSPAEKPDEGSGRMAESTVVAPPGPTLPPVATAPVGRSWNDLTVPERQAKAKEWGVKAPEGFAAWSPVEKLAWLDSNFPLDPFNPVVPEPKEQEPEW